MNEIKVYYKDISAVSILSEHLKKKIQKDTIIVCIGTDRCIGDSLGPLVGTLLKRSNLSIPIYGTLKHPIHAINLKEEIKRIQGIHKEAYVIAIDACLGEESLIGCIQLRPGPIFPGKGVGKTLPSVGDISIVGIVDKFSVDEYLPIHNIRLSLVMDMAEVITKAFLSCPLLDYHHY